MPDLSAIETAFWATVVLMLYTLKGYPVLLAILTCFRAEPPAIKATVLPKDSDCPKVSFIVAAFNEEKNISAKLDNLLGIEYPDNKIEFIIGSDASDDDTDRILNEAAHLDSRITQFRLEKRSGKIMVLREAVRRASGSILIFTDCSVKTNPDIMPIILDGMKDDRVGLISSRDIWVDSQEDSPQSQHQYIDYEMKIRRNESRFNSLVSVSGSFFAIRTGLFQSYDDNLADDFALPLLVYRQGFRVIHRDDLIGYVPMVRSSGAELIRRTRIIAAGIRTVLANVSLLNPFRYPIFAWQLWSHKVLKWLFPFMLFANLILAIALWEKNDIYRAAACAYGLIFALAFGGRFIRHPGSMAKPFRLANFFVLSMTAVLKAWFNVLTGSKAKTWSPTHR
ncbi:MAG: glycosyltransferase [FCB group bacterium]|nr:glycosyltransferase [FCB group bacterium]